MANIVSDVPIETAASPACCRPSPAREQGLSPDQAMTLQESAEIAPNHIVSSMQKGYSIHDRLLRPAMVIVAKAGSQSAQPTEAENT